MPKSKQQKQLIVDRLINKIGKSKSMVFVDYKGLKVKEIDELRNQCRKENNEYLVAKKTLIQIAIDKNNIQGVSIKGSESNLAIVLGYEDEIAPAKTVKDFTNKYKDFKTLGGVMEGKYIDSQMVKALANIPSRTELYAKLVGSLNSPISGFVGVLKGNLRNLVGVLNAIKEVK